MTAFRRLARSQIILSLVGLQWVPEVFIAPSEDPVFTATLEMPLGTSIEASQEVVAVIDRFLKKRLHNPTQEDGDILNWLTFVGEGGPRFALSLTPPNSNPANSFLIASTTHGEVVDEVVGDLRAYIGPPFLFCSWSRSYTLLCSEYLSVRNN